MTSQHSDLALRPANPEDAPIVARIWHDAWGDGHLGNVPDALVAVRTREWFDAWAAQRVPHATVATVGGDIAGFVVVVDDEVEQVYVDRRHRGAGVANVLLAEAERQVAANGHDRAWLAVVGGNARARRFYERNGWHSEGLFDYLATTADGPLPVPCHRYVKPVSATTTT
ncbi:GNAT family N-acetyltransferase [Allorhizocola rhizosphaerae]|uniref:GNAT family N-acetyltransferase n=1 Tax=Allorhizocola rhizosphaerae TaxID=1872709 RepID=UPI000E3E013D|nr:GNAT family N-acetyltransferase [Allorhizocola rhizosphaerae]